MADGPQDGKEQVMTAGEIVLLVLVGTLAVAVLSPIALMFYLVWVAGKDDRKGDSDV